MTPLKSNYLAVSFTEPMKLMGVEVKIFTLNIVLAFFIIGILKIYAWGVVMVLLHFVFKMATTNEPEMRAIYIKYQMQSDSYESFSKITPSSNLRPNGFGRKEI